MLESPDPLRPEVRESLAAAERAREQKRAARRQTRNAKRSLFAPGPDEADTQDTAAQALPLVNEAASETRERGKRNPGSLIIKERLKSGRTHAPVKQKY